MARRRIVATVLAAGALAWTTPAQALVPYVYLPTPEERRGSSIGIGRTAAQLLQLGQPREAAQLAALAVRLQPDDERLWSVLAEAQLRSNQLTEASRSLARAKALNPDKAGLWFAEAAIALRSERPDEAVSLLRRGLQLDPKNAAAYFDLGNARILQRNLPSALEAFEQATGLKPSFWEALNNQALVLYEMGQRDEAIVRWRRVLTIDNNPEPMLALAAALHRRGGAEQEALTLAKDALAGNPNYVLPLHQVEQLWGPQIRQATADLLMRSELRDTVERAQANATWKKSN
ncbi:tetratricopeptide repeat protein [Parasynechococcus sp.]|uniref:tetratricopeptide repeat protein n=1 Tax=Parasynechococcus sp. TaxID=3101203 RepID=UPI00370408FC